MNSLNIIDVTNNSIHGRLRKRFDAILGRASQRNWALEEFTRGWTDEQSDFLRDHFRKLNIHPKRGQALTLVDTDMIRSYLYAPVPKFVPGKTMSRDQTSRLKNIDVGTAVVVQVPILCTGSHIHDDILPDLQRMGLIGDAPPKYVRAGAHGPTFGTLLAKVVRKNWEDGKFAGPAVVKTALVCNNCLDLFCGPLVEGRRLTDTIPDQWNAQHLAQIQKLQDRHSRESNKADAKMPTTKVKPKGRQSTRRSVKDIVTDDMTEGSQADELMKCTVVQLRSRLKALDLPVSGVKAELVDRLITYN